MKFYIEDFFGKYDQICSFLWIWSQLLKKSLIENFIFCAVFYRTEIRASEHFQYVCSKKSPTKFHLQTYGYARSKLY